MNETYGQSQSGGQEMIQLRRSLLNEGPLVLLLVFTAPAAVFLSAWFPGTLQFVQLNKFVGFDLHIMIPLFGIIPLLIFAIIWHRIFDAKYIIADDHVRSISGFLSFGLKDVRVDYHNVRGIEINRSLYQRLLNLGDIQVGSAMHADVEMTMIGIYKPGRYREIMEKRMEKRYEDINARVTKRAVGADPLQ